MKIRIILSCLALLVLAVAASAQKPIPHLEKRGAATQLIVDGKPFLVLGGEADNTATSSLEYMN